MTSCLRGETMSAHRLYRLVLCITVLAVVLTTCKSPTNPSQSGCPIGQYVPLPATDVWPCPPASAIHEINSEITLEFSDDPTTGKFVCHATDGSLDLTSLQERTYQALYLLKRLQFDAPLPWTTDSLWTWFIASVQTIQYFSPGLGKGQGGGDVAYFNRGVIYLPAYIPQVVVGAAYATDQGFPTNILGFVHEARHAQKYHDCGNTKDMTISEFGAWGVQYYFGLWLADHTISPPLSDAERAYARQASQELRGSGAAFCTPCGGI